MKLKIKKSKIEGRGLFTLEVIPEGAHISLAIKEFLCLNHCCKPNCVLLENTFGVKTLRNIESGEELVFDYRLTEYKDYFYHDIKELVGHCLCSECWEEIQG